MRAYQNDDLLRLLGDEIQSFRMLAQHFLCEGYADDVTFLDRLFAGWDRWGAEQAFPEFPMLSFVPIPAARVEECCQRAAVMVEGRPLTELTTRCAGKLIEQVVRLPAADLRPHLETIEATTQRSKIFFRVDTAALRQRLELVDEPADTLAQRLDSAIESLALDANNAGASQSGLHALESLRRGHPDYMNLAGVLAPTAAEAGPAAASFRLTMQSLVHFPETGLESSLGKHLLDIRESVHVGAVEVLVRCGTPAAAQVLLTQYPLADPDCQKWIARGLQRLRAPHLAEKVAELRAASTDPMLWLMLLVAEVRQLDQQSIPRVVSELARIPLYSGALIDALNVFARVHEESPGARELQSSFMEYLQRANEKIEEKLSEHRESGRPSEAGQLSGERFRKRKS